MKLRLTALLVGVLIATACGGGGDGGNAAAPDESAPADTEATPDEAAEPTYDYTPLESAKAGDLIELSEYPFVAGMTTTQDVRGMESLAVKVIYVDGAPGPRFSPSVLVGSPGQKITLTGFKSDDAPAPHTFTIDSTGINMQWGDKKPKPVTVTFPKKGILGFYCKFHVPTNDSYMGGLLQVKA